ncbi:Protein of unknown function [Kushneria avicenniae]|uniref:DUF4235 domain-containing protein n=1 Tax=Kushneria avicenniae TaxID=402385 RepID=A0A1I1MKG8_9GAMM|nr:DUF4235 domain-containing protein [Kushneria avicenniae]SFC85586.1 Protein of unknown function [Kushneria avicenniae]
MKSQTLWTLVGTATAAATGIAMRQAMKKTFRHGVFEPPVNPDRDDVEWRQAILWGAASGMAVGAARIVGWKVASAGMRRTRRSRRGQRLLARIEDQDH